MAEELPVTLPNDKQESGPWGDQVPAAKAPAVPLKGAPAELWLAKGRVSGSWEHVSMREPTVEGWQRYVREDAALSATAPIAWKPHTELPPAGAEPFSALLAFRDGEGDTPDEAILAGIYVWARGRFADEHYGTKAKEPFFWIPERAVTASVPPPQFISLGRSE